MSEITKRKQYDLEIYEVWLVRGSSSLTSYEGTLHYKADNQKRNENARRVQEASVHLLTRAHKGGTIN